MRHALTLVPLLSVPLLSIAACGGGELQPGPSDISTVSLANAIPADQAGGTEGIAIDRASGHLFVLNRGAGIVEIDDQGKVINRYPPGESGLETTFATDVARLADGRFVLATNGDTMLWDPEAKTQESFFCLVPAIGDQWLENGAVTLDPEAARIIAAPAYYEGEGGGPQTSWHAAYSAVDGEFINQVDVRSTGFVAQGLAFDRARNRMFAVEENKLGIFSAQGVLLQTLSIEVEDASGLAIDPAADRVYVSQRGRRDIAVFSFSEM